MEIKPSYVTFELAKLLKKNGFDIPVRCYYRITGFGVIDYDMAINHNDDEKQETAGGMTYVSAPEQWQVVEWILSKYEIWVYVTPSFGKWRYDLKFLNSNDIIYITQSNYLTSQEAYSAAFDYVLNNVK